LRESIQINKDLHFDYEDLMVPVDLETPFTLRDVLRATMQSVIPIEIIKRMICPWVEDYWNEAESKPYEKDNDMEYLELYLFGDVDKKDITLDSLSWLLHGVGREGIISEDVVKFYSKEEVLKMISEGHREQYAIDFSPMYTIADLEIKVKREISVTIYGDREFVVEKINVRPNLTLFDLLTSVFWEISFMGPPTNRDKKRDELNERASEVDKWSKEGTLDQHTFSWDSIKDKFLA
jgi:hypothetical protein